MKRVKAFTLIELLIVVAIIAILAAIAVPNFLEAQVRSKVSRVKADMRSAATALESYYTDYNHYPYDGYNWNGSSGMPTKSYNYWYLPVDITTPIAYLTHVGFIDPFRSVQTSATAHWQWKCIRYTCVESTWGETYDNWGPPGGASTYFEEMMHEFGGWRLSSAGPDRTYGPNGWPGISTIAPYTYPVTAIPLPYDPTNGTVSDGDIIRSQKATNGYVNAQ